MNDFTKTLLESIPEEGATLEQKFVEVTPEQFEELSKKVEELRQKALQGQKHSVEEMKLIVQFFRARRGKAFCAAKKKEKPKRISKKAQREAEAKALLGDLFAGTKS